MVSTTIKLAEREAKIYTEMPNYNFNSMVADIGGALSLALGLRLYIYYIYSRVRRIVKRVKFDFTQKPT
jgi:hypothetical protein